MLIDTHCHIHDDDYPLDIEQVMAHAHQAGVMQMICIGTSSPNSQLAMEFVDNHDGVFASVGVHPHSANEGLGHLAEIIRIGTSMGDFSIKAERSAHKLIAIGEIGLDYHYSDGSPHDVQKIVLVEQIKLAMQYNLPIIFHVREAFDDFWPIIDGFINAGQQIKGVLHSFTDSQKNADEAIKRGLYIGVNGYSTFTKDEATKAMFAGLPLDKILLETDAPYLTPNPFRGKVNEPAFVRSVAEFHGAIRQISTEQVENITTANAQKLFKL
jgi:TatD DNase family protein